MATIPEVPPEQKIVPIDGGRRQQIPTYDNGSVTPENTFTTPFIAGEKTAQLVGNIADQFNKAADKTALEDGAKMGYLEQQRNIEEGNREYSGSNLHNKHLHISINPAMAADTSPWFWWLNQPKIVNQVVSKLIPAPAKKAYKKEVCTCCKLHGTKK